MGFGVCLACRSLAFLSAASIACEMSNAFWNIRSVDSILITCISQPQTLTQFLPFLVYEC